MVNGVCTIFIAGSRNELREQAFAKAVRLVKKLYFIIKTVILLYLRDNIV